MQKSRRVTVRLFGGSLYCGTESQDPKMRRRLRGPGPASPHVPSTVSAAASAPTSAPACERDAPSSLVVLPPELVGLILSHLDSGDIARVEGVSSTFLAEGRRTRLDRNDISFLDPTAKRTRTGYTYEGGYKFSHFEVIPMFRHAKYSCRDQLLARVDRVRLVPVSRRMFGFSDFFRHMYSTRRGLLRRSPGCSALRELQGFYEGMEEALTGVDPFWELMGARAGQLAFSDEQNDVLKAAFVKHAKLLSYGTLYLVCYFAKYLTV